MTYGKGNSGHVRNYRRYALTGAGILGILFLIIGYSMTGTLVSVFALDNRNVLKLAAEGFRLD